MQSVVSLAASCEAFSPAAGRGLAMTATTAIHMQDDRKARPARSQTAFTLAVVPVIVTVFYLAIMFDVPCACGASSARLPGINATSWEAWTQKQKAPRYRLRSSCASDTEVSVRTHATPSPSNENRLRFAKLRLRGAGCGTFALGGHSLPPWVDVQHVPRATSAPMEPATIDYIVTYVNPLKMESAPGAQERNPQRIRDWNELYWNLRSLFYHGRLCVYADRPGRCLLGKIHLVVANKDHVPEWLARRLNSTATREEAPKLELNFRQFLRDRLQVVEHRSIFPPGTPYQESFNSNVIELSLHRIPGLSPLYLYSNNDMFLGRELKLSDLFAPAHLELMNDEHCDLVPLTYHEPPLREQRFPYLTPEDVNGHVALASGWSVPRNPSGLTEFERMIEFNIFLLSTPNYSLPFLRRRWDAGDASAIPLLRYPHLPVLYDKAVVEWMLRHPSMAPSVQDTMTRPLHRGPTDVWLPYLYINTKRLALFGPLQSHERVFREVDASMYRFSMLTDASAVGAEFNHVRSSSPGFSPELFITLNDDFAAALSSPAVNPSRLFDDTASEVGTIRCDANFISATTEREQQAVVPNWLAARTVRQLIQMHELYCRWEEYWARQPNVAVLNL